VVWDRKIDSGFPETKELKNRVRNVIAPTKDLGHIDRSLSKAKTQIDEAETTKRADSAASTSNTTEHVHQTGEKCEDCP
jgi:hypothetical protein